MKTYKDDESFFNFISIIKVSTGKREIHEWLLDHEPSRFRFILDREADDDFLNMEQREEIYPGIKSIAIVSNPWKRAWVSYKDLKTKANETNNTKFEIYKLETFESYLFQVFQNLKLKDFMPEVWFDFNTQQKDWLTYNLNGDIKKAEYVLRLENINEDLRPLQEYFLNNRILDIYDPNLDYKEYYNKRSIDLIADVFKDDIEMFRYNF
jgi:hypothetical protein